MSIPIIHSYKRVNEAISEAEAIASEKGVPLTVERLAASLGMSREEFVGYVHARPSVLSNSELRIRRLLCDQYNRIGAALAEELMKSGSHTGAVFLGKNNFGYTDKADVKADLSIAFTGETELSE